MSWLTDLQETFQRLLNRMLDENWIHASTEKKARATIINLLHDLLSGEISSLHILSMTVQQIDEHKSVIILVLDALLVQLASVPLMQTLHVKTLRELLPDLFELHTTGNSLAKSLEIATIPKGCVFPDRQTNSFESLLRQISQHAKRGFDELGGLEAAFTDLNATLTELQKQEINSKNFLKIISFLNNALNLARIYRKKGNFRQAIQLYENVLVIQNKIDASAAKTAVATTQTFLGMAYFKTGKYIDAQTHLEAAIAHHATMTQNTPIKAAALFYLAETLLDLGQNIENAEKYYKQALAMQPQHNTKEKRSIFLGLAKAEEMLAAQPQIVENHYQNALMQSHEDDPELVEIHTGLANILLLFQSYAAAKQHFTRALDISQRLHQLPEDRIKAWTGLANTLVAMKKFNAAKKIYDRILHSLNGQESPLLAVILTHYANLMILLKEFSIGEQLLLRAWQLAKKHYGENSPVIAAVDHHLGELYIDLANFQCARKYLEHSLAIKESFYKKNHSKYAITQRALAWVNYKEDKLQQAISLMQEAHSVFVQNNMPQQYITERALAEIRSALATQQNAAQPCCLLRLFGCVPTRQMPAVYATPQLEK